MKILVTGSKGFLGKNLTATLRNYKEHTVFEYDIGTDSKLLDTYTKECDFVFHLAGVNRPEKESEFMEGNFGFTSVLLNLLIKNKNKSPLLITSSIQAEKDNPYGKSKKAAEDLVFKYGKDNNVKVYVYRLANVFGKWCRPNYNSVTATFCHNIANNLPINIHDENAVINLCYVDDIIEEFLSALTGNASFNGDYCVVNKTYQVALGKLAKLIYSFRDSRQSLLVADMADEFTKKLYSTYTSYIPQNDIIYTLKMNKDERGSFTEFLKTENKGQVSVNISKPGIVKGNHWHHSKTEKFLVVSGKGIIRMRKIDCDDILIYNVSGDNLQVVDIPCGYTHNIENIGDTDMVTIMWANEPFNPEKPDTYFLEV